MFMHMVQFVMIHMVFYQDYFVFIQMVYFVVTHMVFYMVYFVVYLVVFHKVSCTIFLYGFPYCLDFMAMPRIMIINS